MVVADGLFIKPCVAASNSIVFIDINPAESDYYLIDAEHAVFEEISENFTRVRFHIPADELGYHSRQGDADLYLDGCKQYWENLVREAPKHSRFPIPNGDWKFWVHYCNNEIKNFW